MARRGKAVPQAADASVEADGPLPKRAGTSAPHYHGHRQRLRDRFLASKGDGLADYELLELLLFHSIPRIDVKPLAKRLVEQFGSLGAVLSADPDRLAEVKGVSPTTVVLLKAVRESGLRLGLEEVLDQPVLTSWNKLIKYCRAEMAHDGIEQFRVLYLNRRNMLIADEEQGRGTVDHTPVYPREVVKRALELGATAIIMVHNHPSGDPTPSRADIEMTREVQKAGAHLGITLHDHVVIARKGHSSFKAMGYL